jgi:hypothetical protein
MYEVLRSKTCEPVPFAQLEDSLDGRANRLETPFACSIKRLPRQNILHIDIDRYTVRASLSRQFVGNLMVTSISFHYMLTASDSGLFGARPRIEGSNPSRCAPLLIAVIRTVIKNANCPMRA